MFFFSVRILTFSREAILVCGFLYLPIYRFIHLSLHLFSLFLSQILSLFLSSFLSVFFAFSLPFPPSSVPYCCLSVYRRLSVLLRLTTSFPLALHCVCLNSTITLPGSVSDHRIEVMESLQALNSSGVRVEWFFGFGRDLEYRLRRAKIVLNLRYYRLESEYKVSRLIPLLAKEK